MRLSYYVDIDTEQDMCFVSSEVGDVGGVSLQSPNLNREIGEIILKDARLYAENLK